MSASPSSLIDRDLIGPGRPAVGGWARLELSPNETVLLERHIDELVHQRYLDVSAIREHTTAAWLELSPATQFTIRQFALGLSLRPELYIVGLPTVADLPPTPTSGDVASMPVGPASEFLMMTICEGLGSPISYRDQRRGNVIHDIYPTRANATVVSSQSSTASLGFHSEMFFHPDPPDLLMLSCLRADPARRAVTSVAAFADVEAELSLAQREILRLPLFALDLASLHGSYTCAGRRIDQRDPRPIISVTPHRNSEGTLRFEPELTTALTREAHEALHEADVAAARVAAHGRLEAGGMLLVDNRRSVHSRSDFPAAFDGTDRWLRRMMIDTAGLPDGLPLRRDDLELAQVWASRGATLRTVPYTISEQAS